MRPMMKLYRKSELYFALAMIAVYVFVFGTLRSLGDDSPYMALSLLLFAALLFVFVKRNSLMEKYGLSGWAKNSRQMLYFIPLWIVTTGNLWGGLAPKYEGLGLLCAVVMFALVGFVEELIFRGLAYRRMRWYIKPVPAMILSAMYFAAVHGNWLQGIYAFIMGVLLAFAYERFHSILAPMLIHIGANTVSVIISETELLEFVYEDDTAFLIATVIAVVLFVITFYLMVTYVWPRKKTDAGSVRNGI